MCKLSVTICNQKKNISIASDGKCPGMYINIFWIYNSCTCDSACIIFVMHCTMILVLNDIVLEVHCKR